MTRVESRKRATAYHEAGHAVVAFHLDLPFKYVTIIARDDACGNIRFGRMPKWSNPDVASFRPSAARDFWQNRAISTFAGRIAEEKFLSRRARWGYERDYKHIADSALEFGGGNSETCSAWGKWLFLRSQEAVATHWDDIKAVAEALVERERLTREDVRRIINDRIDTAMLPITVTGVRRKKD